MRLPTAITALLLAAGAPSTAAFAQDPMAVWTKGQADYLAWNGARRGWITTDSGLQAHRLKRGKDRRAMSPTVSDTVTIHYEGRLIDGAVFDSSWARGEPATFPLEHLIKGWQEGVPMMKPGETWEFAVPGPLAYGERGRPSIPPNAALLFRIQLIAVEKGV